MDRYERVVTCKVMRLRSQETLSGRKEYIVVGTTIITGEEFQCKGKVGGQPAWGGTVKLLGKC